MKQKYQASNSRKVDQPLCLKCDKPMQLISIEEEYPGYSRLTFGCQPCDGTMTQWAATPTETAASNENSRLPPL